MREREREGIIRIQLVFLQCSIRQAGRMTACAHSNENKGICELKSKNSFKHAHLLLCARRLNSRPEKNIGQSNVLNNSAFFGQCYSSLTLSITLDTFLCTKKSGKAKSRPSSDQRKFASLKNHYSALHLAKQTFEL